MNYFHVECLLKSETECGNPDVFDERHSMAYKYDCTPLLMEMVCGKDRFLEATGYRLSCFLITYVSAKQAYAITAFNYFYCLLISLH